MKTINYFLRGFLILFMIFSGSNIANASGCAELVFNQNLGANGSYETLRLDITFGNTPTDFSWLIVDSNFNQVKGSFPSDFTNYNAGDSATFYINMSGISTGDHNFLAINQKGLGMDGGSYTIYSSKDNSVIATSGNFTYSEATTFCYYNSNQNGILDNTPPTNPTNLSIVSTTNTSATISWLASTDTQQSLIAYYIIVDGEFKYGVYAGITTFTIPNLIPGTNYDISVIAYDAMSNLSVGISNVVTVNTGNANNSCSNGNQLQLNLNFNANPQYVKWVIKDASYQVVDQRTYYTNQAPNSSISEMITLPTNNTGDYLLQVFDATGNGGSSFSLTDSSGTVVSGNSIGFSSAVQFCINSTSVSLDTQKPSAPQNLLINNINNAVVDLSWDPSNDNVGVTEYLIRSGNASGAITSNTNYAIGPLSDATYDFNIICTDAAGNISDASNIATAVIQTPSTTTLHEGFFETGWDDWIDGGQNARRVSNANAYEGDRCVRLRNGTNDSKITLENLQLANYDEVELSFIFISRGIENGEVFRINYFDGNNWINAATFTKGVMFNNGQFGLAVVRLDSGSFNLANNAKFEISLEGNQNNDRIFIDVTKVKGEIKSSYISRQAEKPRVEIIPVDTKELIQNISEKTDFNKENNDLLSDTTNDLTLYPNPSTEYFSIKNIETEGKVLVMSISGKILKTFNTNQKRYNISDLDSGLYYIKIQGIKNHKPMILIKK